jgi:hypothetical protein
LQDSSLEITHEGYPEYLKIANIANESDKQKAIQEYLGSWYSANSKSSWHDSHLGENNTYVGYWSFEAAAVAKIFQLNSKLFKNNECFPQGFYH